MQNEILPGSARRTIQLYPTIIYLLAFFAFWSAIDIVLRQEPPMDNFEQLNWALHPALGYFKHPPFPTWILWLAEQVFPSGILLTYLLGAAEVLLMLCLAHSLGRATLGAYRGWLGTLLITCISYHTLRMHFYNHNTALLCANAAAMLCAWHAGATLRARWWILLGACWAVGMLCKYQMVVPIACNALYLCWRLGGINRRFAGLISLSAAAAAILLLPHFVWLVQNQFPTFEYASSLINSSLRFVQRFDVLLRFLASQLLRVMPVILLCAVLYALARRSGDDPDPPADAAAQRFWAIHALGSLALMSLMGLIGGILLEMHWGTAFLWALPMWFLSTKSGATLTRLRTSQAMIAVGVTQALLIGGKILFPHL